MMSWKVKLRSTLEAVHRYPNKPSPFYKPCMLPSWKIRAWAVRTPSYDLICTSFFYFFIFIFFIELIYQGLQFKLLVCSPIALLQSNLFIQELNLFIQDFLVHYHLVLVSLHLYIYFTLRIIQPNRIRINLFTFTVADLGFLANHL